MKNIVSYLKDKETVFVANFPVGKFLGVDFFIDLEVSCDLKLTRIWNDYEAFKLDAVYTTEEQDDSFAIYRIDENGDKNFIQTFCCIDNEEIKWSLLERDDLIKIVHKEMMEKRTTIIKKEIWDLVYICELGVHETEIINIDHDFLDKNKIPKQIKIKKIINDNVLYYENMKG